MADAKVSGSAEGMRPQQQEHPLKPDQQFISQLVRGNQVFCTGNLKEVSRPVVLLPTLKGNSSPKSNFAY